jgi:hypothetical protein
MTRHFIDSDTEAEALGYLWTPGLDSLFWREERPDAASGWWGHVPFAHWIIGASKPRVFVELGTHHGVSYYAFCEAVLRNKLDTRCYAVDTWKGDDQAGHYGEDVYNGFRRFHDGRYGSFSEPLRCSFDEALQYLSEASIDLLHIDGFHTYEVVRHDFEAWRPKLSERAVVLFHDTNVREGDFGVWRLWEELRQEYSCFEFLHGHGLGVLAFGRAVASPIATLCSLADSVRITAIRERFSFLGEHSILVNRCWNLENENELRQREFATITKAADEYRLAADAASENVKSRSEFITRLEDQIRQLEEQLHSQVAQSAERVRQLEEQLLSQSAQSAERVHQLEERLHSQVAQSSSKVRQLEEEVASVNVARDGERRLRHGMMHSSSWRLTRPLRLLRDTVAIAINRMRRRDNSPFASLHGSTETTTEKKGGNSHGTNRLDLKATLPDDPSVCVNALYKAAFGRLADPEGLANRIHQLQSGVSLEILAKEFVGSLEFQTRHGLDQNVDIKYIAALYRDGLGREPDPEGLAHWLAAGATRAKMLAALASSDEAIEKARASSSTNLEKNPSVASAGIAPFQHYRTIGWREGGSRQHSTPTPAIETRLSLPIFDPQPIATASGIAQLACGSGRRLICVSHVMPYPPRAGNAYRIHRMLTWLTQRNWEIMLVVCPLPNETVTERQLSVAAAMYPNIVLCQRDGTLLYRLTDRDKMLEGLRGRRPRAFPLLLGETEAADERERNLLAIMRSFSPDVLIELLLYLEAKFDPQALLAEYVFMTRPFALLRPSLFKIVDTVEVFSTTRDTVMQYGIDEVLTLEPEIEARLLNRADLLIAIQEAEAKVLRKLAPQRQLVTVGIDFTLPGEASPSATRPVAMLVASRNPMNVKGLKDFLRFAWPLVRRALPESELWVIGPVGEVAEPVPPGVKILGQVEDLGPVYADARVIINPAVAGTGLKIKTIEAICHLRPIVLWPSGVDGIDPQVRQLCHIATDWFDFARHVIRLAGEEDGAQALNDRRAELAQYFAPDAVYAPLNGVLDNACGTLLDTPSSIVRIGNDSPNHGNKKVEARPN